QAKVTSDLPPIIEAAVEHLAAQRDCTKLADALQADQFARQNRAALPDGPSPRPCGRFRDSLDHLSLGRLDLFDLPLEQAQPFTLTHQGLLGMHRQWLTGAGPPASSGVRQSRGG